MTVYSIVALLLAAVFVAIGAVQLKGPAFVRDAYARWDYAESVRPITGTLDIVAGLMLAAPALRGWGIALAAVLSFGAGVVFLSHQQYRHALSAIALMAALIPAAAAVPLSGQVQFVQRVVQQDGPMKTVAASHNPPARAAAPDVDVPSEDI
jgi:hypothetical protein